LAATINATAHHEFRHTTLQGITSAPVVLDFNHLGGSIHAVNSTFEWSDTLQFFNEVGRNPYFSGCSFLRNSYARRSSLSSSQPPLATAGGATAMPG
jgi:hypothetical protein